MECDCTIEAHLAFSGARAHSNNTAEMTAMIEALSFLGPHGPVARDEQSCIYYDSQHAAGVCLGTIQARTHVRVGTRMSTAQQHVYGHSGNLGNECADHAAALGTFGLTSNHNVVTRWIRNNFDTSVCFDGCNNISEVLERFAAQTSEWESVLCIVFLVLLICIFVSSVILLSAFFSRKSTLFFRTSYGKPFFVCLYRLELW